MFEFIPKLSLGDCVFTLCELDRTSLDFHFEQLKHSNEVLHYAVETLTGNVLMAASPGMEAEFPEMYQRLHRELKFSYLALLAMVDCAAKQTQSGG